MKNFCRFLLFLFTVFSLHGATLPLDSHDPRWHWMDEQIEEQFSFFKKKGITRKMLDQTIRMIPEISFGSALLRFQIVNRKVYGPEGNVKELLKRVTTLYSVPDVDVILHEQDIIWNPWVLPSPVLATCKIKESSQQVIHFPLQLWSEWENEFVGSVENASHHSPWESKVAKIFWRGCTNDADNYNNREEWIKSRRGKLCYLSKQFPDSIDATFTSTHSWLIQESLQEEFFRFFLLKRASWEEYLQHKYLIDLDGYAASTPGFAWKLLSNCTVFKHDSKFTLWFYKALLPWKHYIPLNEDLSDIFQKLQWAKEHDLEAHQIAENGRCFAKENLMPEHLYLYCYKVLVKYAALQRFTPMPRSD